MFCHKYGTKIIVMSLVAVLALDMAGCNFMLKKAADTAQTIGNKDTETVTEKEKETEEAGEALDEPIEGEVKSITRKHLLPSENDESEIKKIRPAVEDIEIASDMSNIINIDEYEYYGDDMLGKLKKNGFAVSDGAGREFYEIYENNRYLQIPSFVTVDSMMHTYHIYFEYLMRDIEKEHLYDELVTLTSDMLNESMTQYKELKGSEWEEAAKRNVAFFSVASKLLDEDAKIDADVEDTVSHEYDLIMAAEGVDTSEITDDYEDYSQYAPRGYYKDDKVLEKYFRTMMWYGRIHFSHDSEDLDRSAMLITLALDNGNYDRWSSVYAVTSFFAGASDDLGYCEYMPVMEDVYGKEVTASDIAGREKEWKEFYSLTGKLRAPRINSIPIDDTEDADNVIPGYRFMGQRFTIDATIMQELVYRRVGEFEDEDKRLLPDFLDVPAALGSDMAYSILDDAGVTKYKNYDRNLRNMKKEFNNDDEIWNASLYASWLNTLRPLLEEKGKGYPSFMRNDEWVKKDLEAFAGSYTELKHDTILYSKQMMAEMGGGWDDEKDYRGYVEPEPLVFLRFANLARNTAEGLKEMGYLSKADEENLEKLADLADRLKAISIKELQNEKLDDDEYELIEIYGGEIEHFWIDAMKAQTGNNEPTSDRYPAALVVDVATDPNGRVLEMATGDPATIYVVVPVEGRLRIAQGSVYSFYEFEQPMSGRLTDQEWRKMMGFEVNDSGNYAEYGKAVDHPDWTKSYRYSFSYSDD